MLRAARGLVAQVVGHLRAERLPRLDQREVGEAEAHLGARERPRVAREEGIEARDRAAAALDGGRVVGRIAAERIERRVARGDGRAGGIRRGRRRDAVARGGEPVVDRLALAVEGGEPLLDRLACDACAQVGVGEPERVRVALEPGERSRRDGRASRCGSRRRGSSRARRRARPPTRSRVARPPSHARRDRWCAGARIRRRGGRAARARQSREPVGHGLQRARQRVLLVEHRGRPGMAAGGGAIIRGSAPSSWKRRIARVIASVLSQASRIAAARRSTRRVSSSRTATSRASMRSSEARSESR